MDEKTQKLIDDLNELAAGCPTEHGEGFAIAVKSIKAGSVSRGKAILETIGYDYNGDDCPSWNDRLLTLLETN